MKEYKYKINGNLYKVSVGDIDVKNVHVEVNGTPYTVELEKEAAPKIKPIARAAAPAPAPAPAAPAMSRPAPAGQGGIKSPLPGVILEIKVNKGDTVKRGQTLMILEAMKMEIPVVAPQDGTVATINVAVGDAVESGDVLATMN